MEKTKSNILIRTLTACILAPLVIVGLYLGDPYIVMMLIAVGALMAWEWSSMVPNTNPTVYAVSYTVSMAVAVMINAWMGIGLTLVFTTLLVWFKAKSEPHRKLLTLGVPYIAIGLGSLMWMYYNIGFNILCFVLIIWATDTGGYIFGKNLKGPKLAPKISPNKTWSGLFGGMFLAGVVTWGYLEYLGDFGMSDYIEYRGISSWYLIMFGAFLAVPEQIGDLIESAIKRHLNLKDSSALIPGHGGVFDRIDGMIFTAPFVYLMIFYFL